MSRFSCELLSELYFYLWFPTNSNRFYLLCLLWIAFRIVFLLMIPNISDITIQQAYVVNCFQNCIFTYDSQQSLKNILMNVVVNCFQNCIFTYDSQHNVLFIWNKYCCELLSELYFYLWFPTGGVFITKCNSLWIAFRIVFLLMIPNKNMLNT